MKNKEPLLIALHGLPGVGKDKFASCLDRNCWSKVSFAAPLRNGLSVMFDIPMEDIDNPTTKNAPNYKFGRSIRYMLQTLGTEWGRNLIADDVWMKLAKEKISHQFSLGMNVVNTDLRFSNEVDLVKSLGGYIIHIIRPDNSNADNANKTGVSNHPSNFSIPSELIDYTIINDKSLQCFEDDVVRVANEIVLNRN